MSDLKNLVREATNGWLRECHDCGERMRVYRSDPPTCGACDSRSVTDHYTVLDRPAPSDVEAGEGEGLLTDVRNLYIHLRGATLREPHPEDPSAYSTFVTEKDAKTLERVLRRLRRSTPEGEGEPDCYLKVFPSDTREAAFLPCDAGDPWMSEDGMVVEVTPWGWSAPITVHANQTIHEPQAPDGARVYRADPTTPDPEAPDG